ncbi:MAG: aspartate aminotransferase family protein [Acidimicrobiia bacterium]|nr:aspartate aminotransferase family protein [Acidimicrobiia bacterium]
MRLPENGLDRDEVFRRIRERKAEDADWHGGRTFSLIYPASEEVDAVLAEANRLYVFENALNPFKFPSLRIMEQEVVAMTAALLNAPNGAGGTMTSGGTESILMAMLVARERARVERGVTQGVLLAPYSAHPAFAKAAHFLGLEHRQIPLDDDFRADLDAAAELIDDDTVVVVGSAPGYPHGVVDPIPELAALAAERGAAFHTDACVGGFLLPFVERLGRPVPPFDFRVEGVTSMSADVHKYGYCTKGASVVLHRNDAWLEHQVFLYGKWPGGLYGSPAVAGARPASPIATAWAVMSFLGEKGYVDLARTVMETTDRIQAEIDAMPQLHVWGEPVASVFAFGSEEIDVMAVNDVLDDRGWNLDRQLDPAALHMMISPKHAEVVEELVADLRDAVDNHGESRGAEARYA